MNNINTYNKVKKAISDGFTLVELLIVIGLLGAIALIVISAINPIEQANRARDTRFKADGGQLVSAIDRYFAAKSEFPWMTLSSSYTTDSVWPFVSATDPGNGICSGTIGSPVCSADGLLVSNNELKTEFRSRDFIQNAATADKQIMIGKDSGASSSVYACFIPLAKSTREKSCTDGKVYTISGGARTAVSAGSCTGASVNWVTSGYYVCIPE